jgi:hypothetical protein
VVLALEQAGARWSDCHRCRREWGMAGAERAVVGKSKDLTKNLLGRLDYIVPNNISSGSSWEPLLKF